MAVHRTGGGGATALKFQRAAKGDSGTALITALRVAVHLLDEHYPNGWPISEQRLVHLVVTALSGDHAEKKRISAS